MMKDMTASEITETTIKTIEEGMSTIDRLFSDIPPEHVQAWLDREAARKKQIEDIAKAMRNDDWREGEGTRKDG